MAAPLQSGCSSKGEDASLHAAKILSPGAVISGYNNVKGAMAGDGLAPKIVFPGIRVATGFLLVKMYFRIASVPEGLKMFVAGMRKLSTGISLPIFPTMTAAPPALCTSNVWDKPPARQNTTFPFTFSGESVSCRQNLEK
nr:hypothetical protein Iba_scaffold24565CG0010 [Ipomoea batatas]